MQRNLPKRQKANLNRLITAAALFVLQFIFLVYVLFSFNLFALSVYVIFQVISAITAIRIIYSQSNPSYKIAWIIMILAIPFLGLIMYLMWGRGRFPRRMKKHLTHLLTMTIPMYKQDTEAREKLLTQHPGQQRVTNYLHQSGFPVYQHTRTEYYDLGDSFFPALLHELKKAQKFIFLEFFILARGTMWEQTFEILKAKAKEGVEVRLLYDDMGCISTLPKHFEQKVRECGIQVQVFNPVLPILNNFYLNYRNHQKICVIDGKVGLTGGVNLADEYINKVEAFGHWKDSGLLLEGDGVWSLTVMFLQMWEYTLSGVAHPEENYQKYMPEPVSFATLSKGFVQPFCDGPLNNPNNPAEMTYMQMINNAKKYIYFTTPYLVLDNEMVTALGLAAASGVDVRIITPGIPDKKYVYLATQSFYGKLLAAGVRIYEYTPGFIHAKNVVSDDETAIVGTINMDFRSFYLHFENAVWLCGTDTVQKVKADFLQTLESCTEVHYENWAKRPLRQRFIQTILNAFSPML